MKSKLIFAAAFVCWIAPAQADIIYSVDLLQFGHQPGPSAHAVGTIKTDGTIGALQPNDILSWDLTMTVRSFSGFETTQTSSGVGGFSWTPGSFSATPADLIFDSLNFSASFSSPFVSFQPSFCVGPCGERRIGPTAQFYSQTTGGAVYTIASAGTPAAVPGPIVGAGLPGIVFAGGLLVSYWRRRRI